MSGLVGGPTTVSMATKGASEVKTLYVNPSPSTSRVTAITPTSGYRIRLVHLHVSWDATTQGQCSVYFGTGSSHSTTPSKCISSEVLEIDAADSHSNHPWPDGAGPIGAVDEVVSLLRNGTASKGLFLFQYREE